MQHLLRHVEGLFSEPSGLPDGALIDRFRRNRDESAFGELLRRHGPMVWASCLRMLPRNEAEDAFQAVFLVFLKKADKLAASGSVGPWLHQVVVYAARNARRSRRLAATLPDLEGAGETGAVDGRIDLDEALLGLAGKYREPLVLCHLEGLSRKQAAERLNISEGTLSSLLSRGLEKLRRRLPAYDPNTETQALPAPPSRLTQSTLRCAAAFPAVGAIAASHPASLVLAQGVLTMFLVKKLAVAGVAAVVLVTGLAAGVAYTQQKGEGPPPVSGPPAVKPSADDAAKVAEHLQLAMEIRKLQDEKYACLGKQIELIRRGIQTGTIPTAELIEPIREKALLACDMRAGLPELKADLDEYVKLAEGAYQSAKVRHENGVGAAGEVDKAKIAMLDAKILRLKHLGKSP